MAAALRLMLRVIPKMDQRIVLLAGLHHHIAAASAVAARRAPARNKLFSPEGHATVAAISGLDQNSCFIDEHCYKSQLPIYSVYRKANILARNSNEPAQVVLKFCRQVNADISTQEP